MDFFENLFQPDIQSEKLPSDDCVGIKREISFFDNIINKRMKINFPEYIIKENLAKCFYYLSERHNMWINRYINNKPFNEQTGDIIFTKGKFLNSYRELDITTLYMSEELFKGKTDEKAVLLNMILYKIFNNVNFFKKVGWTEPTRNGITDSLKKAQKVVKPFSSAYLVTSFSDFKIKTCDSIYDKDSKLNRIFKCTLESYLPTLDNILLNFKKCKTYNNIYEVLLKNLYCCGPFLSNEILWGLVHVNFFENKLQKEWSNVGPGCFWTMKWIGCQKPSQYQEVLQFMYDNQDELFEYYNYELCGPKLSMINVENVFCEMRKYMRIKNAIDSGQKGIPGNKKYDLAGYKERTDEYVKLFEKDGKDLRWYIRSCGKPENVQRVF